VGLLNNHGNAITGGNDERWKPTELMDHRNILFNLLFREDPKEINSQPSQQSPNSNSNGHGNKKKKRKRLEQQHQNQNPQQQQAVDAGLPPPLPTWCRIHNIATAAASNVAVIEFQLEDLGC